MKNVSWARMNTFLAVAEQGSIRAAAAHLHVTEPAVSAAVGGIEDQLGQKLLAREGRGIRLTEAGLVYADYCRRILGLLEESAAAVREAETGLLRLGAVTTASETILPRLLASYLREHPSVDVTLSVRSRDELFEELRQHRVDVVIAGRPPSGAGLVSRARRDNTLVVAGAPSSNLDPWSARWLMRSPGSGTRDACLALFEQLQISPRMLTLGPQGAVIAAAREGLGVTLVHADAIVAELAEGSLQILPLTGTPLARPWHLTTNRPASGSANHFVRFATDPGSAGDTAFHLPNRSRG